MHEKYIVRATREGYRIYKLNLLGRYVQTRFFGRTKITMQEKATDMNRRADGLKEKLK